MFIGYSLVARSLGGGAILCLRDIWCCGREFLPLTVAGFVLSLVLLSPRELDAISESLVV